LSTVVVQIVLYGHIIRLIGRAPLGNSQSQMTFSSDRLSSLPVNLALGTIQLKLVFETIISYRRLQVERWEIVGATFSLFSMLRSHVTDVFSTLTHVDTRQSLK
jgi:hypothetical protein